MHTVPLYFNDPLTASIWLPVYDLDVPRFLNQSLVRPVCVIHDVIDQFWQHKIEVS